ncbi:MAG: signal peptidase II, partial [Muribaculaceae bacterium]|nr:signal peptidase II [Muribaculaceae bacterium]
MKINKGCLIAMIICLVIIADQAFKIWVKTNFYMGEDYEITSWFHLKFIENNGMAFGLELWNKMVLTLGRIVAVGFITYFLLKIRNVADIRTGFLVSVSLIAAGAAGNIFDCVFYGQLFDNPYPPQLAQMFPPDGGYAGWFEGRVV